MRIFGSIAKVAPQADGSVRVTGVASSEARDRQGEIVLASAIEDALPDFFRHGTGALREMHSAQRAVGTVDEVEVGADKKTRIVATVVDSEAIKKIKAKVFKAYSIGGRVLARDPDDRKIITAIELAEISLVDAPSNPESVLELFKAVGGAAITDGMTDGRLAKVLADRGRLAKHLADRDAALAELADRVEKTMGGVAKMAADNKRLSEANANLTKRLAEVQRPRVVVDNVMARADQVLATVADLETQTRILAARFDRAGI